MSSAYAFGSGCHIDCPPAPPGWQLALLIVWMIVLGVSFYFLVGYSLGMFK